MSEEGNEEAERWRRIALWLADVHAATASYEGSLSRTSKSSRRRFLAICEKASRMVASADSTIARKPGPISIACWQGEVVDRLDRVAEDLRAKCPDGARKGTA